MPMRPRVPAAAGRGIARRLVCANWSAIALLALLPSLRAAHPSLRAAADILRDLAALFTIFFVPGTALVISFSRRDAIPLSGLLAGGFAATVVVFTACSTLLKLAGFTVGRPLLLAIAACTLAVALLPLLRSRRLPEVVNDLPLSPLAGAAVALSFILLFALLNGYTSLAPRDHWLVEQVGAITFPAEPSPSPPRHDSRGVSRDGRFVDLHGGEGRVAITVGEGAGRPVRVGYLVRADVPGEFSVSAGGVERRYPVPAPFLDGGREVRFQNQAVAQADFALPPGEHAVALGFRDAAGAAAPCTILDFTGLTRERFLEEFFRRYRFVTFVLMYDIMEAEDFVRNLAHRVSLYHSPGTPEMPGYAATNPPLSYIFASLGYVLMGREMAAVNKVAFAVLAASFLASLHLVRDGAGRPSNAAALALLLGTLSLAAALTIGVSLHFMTHFMTLCLLLSWARLFDRRGGAFVLLSFMACLSAWAGWYFVALGLACEAVLRPRDGRWLLGKFVAVTALLAGFLAAFLVIGHRIGMLRPWLDELLWENFRRFGTAHLHQAGSRARFFSSLTAASACLPLALVLRRDARALFFALFSAIFIGTLLAAPSNEWKIHYLSAAGFPLMIAGGRALTLAEGRGGFPGRIMPPLILAGAFAGLVWMLARALGGALLA
ncbi:MAG: hypothetical protein PHN82_03600 [bacterium]|nr:hypothetical protein [bacterium]